MSQVNTGSRSNVPWVYTKPEAKTSSLDRERLVEYVPVKSGVASPLRPFSGHLGSIFSENIFNEVYQTPIENRDCRDLVLGGYPSNLELRKHLSAEGIRGIHDFREGVKYLKTGDILGEDLESCIVFLESGVNRACFHPDLGDLKGILKAELKALRGHFEKGQSFPIEGSLGHSEN